MSTLDKPKKNGTTRSGMTYSAGMTMTHVTHADGSKSVLTQVPSNVWGIGTVTSRWSAGSRKVKKGCGQRKSRRDRAGRMRHAEKCRADQHFRDLKISR